MLCDNKVLLAPIAMFAYNRPQHLNKTIQALAKNPEFSDSRLYIYCDGPKNTADIPATESVRKVVSSFNLPNMILIERERNMGLANSIITGVTDLCERFGRVIVLEDDLVVSSVFLKYMNDALQYYKNNEIVMQVSGHMFPVELHSETDAVFLPFTSSWGWATWERAWKHFNPEATGYNNLLNDKYRRRKFDLNDSYPYFRMLKKQLRGKIDSWAIRWYLSVFDLNGLVLYPCESLVENIGFDGSGTHCRNEIIDSETLNEVQAPVRLPEVELNYNVLQVVSVYLGRKHSWSSRLLKKVLFFRN